MSDWEGAGMWGTTRDEEAMQRGRHAARQLQAA